MFCNPPQEVPSSHKHRQAAPSLLHNPRALGPPTGGFSFRGSNMEYTTEVLDRRSGDLVTTSIGNWITITELGERHGVGRREVRTVLRKMGFLHVEGGRSHQRHRLSGWVTERGWGKRLQRKHRKQTTPFDVIGPEAQDWIAQRWSSTVEEIEASRASSLRHVRNVLDEFARKRNNYRDEIGCDHMSIQEKVIWFTDHHPQLTQVEIASVVEVTQQLAGRYLSIRTDQIRRAKERKSLLLGPKAFPCTSRLDEL